MFGSRGKPLVTFRPNAVAHFSRSAFGKRNGHDFVQVQRRPARGVTGIERDEITFGQHKRLPATGPRRQRHRDVASANHPSLLVGQLVTCHSKSPLVGQRHVVGMGNKYKHDARASE